MENKFYKSHTINNAPGEKIVKITFKENQSLLAETIRALLLAEGYTPAELGLTADNETELRVQAQKNELILEGKNASQFNFFFANALQLANAVRDYAYINGGMKIDLPTV